MLYDQAVHFLDFQGILYTGFTLWGILSLMNKTQTAPFVALAMACQINNGLCFFILFIEILVCKIVNKGKITDVGNWVKSII